jgi:hypothetical protein
MAAPQTGQQSISDDTVKAFLSVPDDKKREALGKMSPEAKTALLGGLKTYKAKNPTQTPTATTQVPPVGQPTTPKAPPSFLPTQPPVPAGEQIKTGIKGIGHNLGAMASTFFGHPAISLPAGAISKTSPEVNIPARGNSMTAHDVYASMDAMNKNVTEAWKSGRVVEATAKTALMAVPVLSAIGSGGDPLAVAASMAFVSPWLTDKFDQAKNGQPIAAAIEVAGTLGIPHLAGKAIPKVKSYGEAAVKWNDTVDKAAKVRSDSFDTSKAALIKITADINRTKVGSLVKSISDEDMVQSANKGLPGSFDPASLSQRLNKFKNEVLGGKASKVETPAVEKATKMINARGKAMSWNDLKQLRTSLFEIDKSPRETAIFAKLDESIESELSKRAKDIGREAQDKAYNTITKAMSEHKNGLLGDLIHAENDQDFFDTLKKANKSVELKNLDSDLAQLGLPDNYLKNLYDSHTNIHRVVSNASAGYSGGKISSLKQHPFVAGTAGAVAYGTVPGFGQKLVASLMATMYAADLANRAGAIEEMKKLPYTGPPKGLLGNALQVKPVGPSPLNPPSAPQGGTPLGMSPSPTPTSSSGPPSAPTGGPATGGVSPAPASPPSAPPVVQPSVPQVKTVPLSEHIIQEGVREIQEIKRAEQAKVTKVPEGQHGTGPEAEKIKGAERKAKERAKSLSEQPRAPKQGGKPMVSESSTELTTVKELEEHIGERSNGKLMLSALRKYAKQEGIGLDSDIYKEFLKEAVQKMGPSERKTLGTNIPKEVP